MNTTLKKFTTLKENDLATVNGGFVPFIITGAMILKGIAALGGGFAIGLGIGKSLKN